MQCSAVQITLLISPHTALTSLPQFFHIFISISSSAEFSSYYFEINVFLVSLFKWEGLEDNIWRNWIISSFQYFEKHNISGKDDFTGEGRVKTKWKSNAADVLSSAVGNTNSFKLSKNPIPSNNHQFKQIYFSLIGKYQIIQNLKMFASCFKLPLVSKREAIAKKSFINQIQ